VRTIYSSIGMNTNIFSKTDVVRAEIGKASRYCGNVGLPVVLLVGLQNLILV
jgi:hypothetical protein